MAISRVAMVLGGSYLWWQFSWVAIVLGGCTPRTGTSLSMKGCLARPLPKTVDRDSKRVQSYATDKGRNTTLLA